MRRTELRRTLQVAGFAIVVGWAMYTAFSAAQSVFLNKAGPGAYPVFFIVLALAVWPMDALQGALTRRFGVGRAFRLNLVANAVAAVCVFIAYTVREDATVAFTAYVVYSVAFELVMLHFWSFVTQHFNVLEGKRIFPAIAAGSSVGYILSGVTTTVVAVFATEPLIFVWGFGSIAAAFMSVNLERTLYRPATVDDADELLIAHQVERKRHGFVAVIRRAIEHVTGSRLVLALVVLGVLVGVASRVGDYLVAVIFVEATHNNLQSLTILIGNAWLVSYAVQLVISLFVAPWVLDRLGVKNAILALPLFTLAGFAAVVWNPILATSLFLFIVRNGLQTGLDDPAQNVLGGALPGHIMPRLKFLLDNAVLPGAAAISGVGLLVFQALAGSDARALAVIGVGVALLFVAGAWWVRSLYLDAVYSRLHAHALSLADFQQAVGRPTQQQLDELETLVRTGDGRTREVAAEALAQAAPEAFALILPELLASADPVVRRLALEAAPPGRLAAEHLDSARDDVDGWVRAAAAVAGASRGQEWPHAARIIGGLLRSVEESERAAAAWAASKTGDGGVVIAALADSHPRVRLEAIRGFARMKGQVDGIAEALIDAVNDPDTEVRREALRQVARWAPPQALRERFAEALVQALASPDRDTRRLVAEAIAAQAPEALPLALPRLGERGESASAAVEALLRSGRPDLYRAARAHLEKQLAEGVHLAAVSARVASAARLADADVAARYALLRIGLEDYVAGTADTALAAMHALHAKRGFATVERGLRSLHAATRIEALETLLNFGPSWLAAPLAKLLQPESFDPVLARPLSPAELDALGKHADRWVRETAAGAAHGMSDHMKELITLKQVPLFSELTLDQLAAIDRLMVTRHYTKGESVFRRGDVGAELYVVVDGEIRIHLDHSGREVTLARHGPGGVVGEMSVFDDQPRSASAQAMADTTVRVLRRDRLQTIVHEHPEVLLEFIKSLSQRLRAMDEKVESEPVAGLEAAPTP